MTNISNNRVVVMLLKPNFILNGLNEKVKSIARFTQNFSIFFTNILIKNYHGTNSNVSTVFELQKFTGNILKWDQINSKGRFRLYRLVQMYFQNRIQEIVKITFISIMRHLVQSFSKYKILKNSEVMSHSLNAWIRPRTFWICGKWKLLRLYNFANTFLLLEKQQIILCEGKKRITSKK